MSSIADKGSRSSQAAGRDAAPVAPGGDETGSGRRPGGGETASGRRPGGDETASGRRQGGGETASGRRHYDARASRQALLDAAAALFDERGYEAATVREIGERAGVDAALIARYFGGKEGLYLATLQEQGVQPGMPAEPVRALAHMLRRAELRGSGPVGRALASPTLTDAMREQVSEIVGRHVVEPLAAELAARGAGDADLRAELLVAIASGVSLTRAAGALPVLAGASLDDVLAVLEPLVDALRA
jgi:AcrR family transcriptional regulator